MSFLEDLRDMLNGRFIFTDVRREYGDGPGDPAAIMFNASSFKDAVVTIQDSDSELIYQGHTKGSVVVAPQQSTWYVLTVTGPEVYEQKVIKVEVRGGNGGNTPAWSKFTREPRA